MGPLKWWQEAVFYQIYPRSFADGNGDGIGDLQGILGKLDYLKDLGIDAVWLSPHYPSPQVDCGYDISDYTGVLPEYGTLADFRQLLDGLHERDIRLILDLVLNHTSDQHPWFLQSRSSLNNPFRDWYIWRDGRDGGPPNNWQSFFGGSAWELDPLTGQYYYHHFFKQQPDLNWSSPAVKQAVFDSVRFWLDLGVDGFRLDAIGTLFEHPDLPDQPVDRSLVELHFEIEQATKPEERRRLIEIWEAIFEYQWDQPGVHEVLKELRSLVDRYDDRVLVGETDRLEFLGSGEDELHMVFNFPLMLLPGLLTPDRVRQNQEERLRSLAAVSADSWPCNALGNHDSSRVYTRFGDGAHDDALARISLALMLTLRGTPFLYNGEEIGMTDYSLQNLEDFRDILGIWRYHAEVEELGIPPEEALRHAAEFGRDKCRTPMQWRNAPHGGFSPQGVETWLPVNPNYAEGVNVDDQRSDPGSLLNFYRRFLRLRKANPALIAGDYQPLHPDAKDYMAFLRSTPRQTCLVVLNMSPEEHDLDFTAMNRASGIRNIFSTHSEAAGEIKGKMLHLEPFEIAIHEVLLD